MELFMVGRIIAIFYNALFIIQHSVEYFECLTFRNHDGIRGHLMCDGRYYSS